MAAQGERRQALRGVRGTTGAARREALLDAADLVVRRDGPEASMAEIAAAAGVTKPVVYRVFASKDGLYAALVERHAAVLVTRLRAALRTPGSWVDRTRRTVDAYLVFLEERPELYRFLQRADEAGAGVVHTRRAAFLQVIVGVVDLGLRSDLGLGPGDTAEPPSLQPTVWANAIVGMVSQVGDWWLATGCAMPRDQVTDVVTSMVSAGVGAALARQP